MIEINKTEYALMKHYIEKNCGIYLEAGKEYLIETRLADLIIETGCNSFKMFHTKAQADKTGKLRDRITDAMTTNETLWFRDESTWDYIKEVSVPFLLDLAEKKGSARVLSAAASTGQEAYSLLMLLDEEAQKRGNPSILDKIEFIGIDISSSAIFQAISASYSILATKRGLPEDKKRKYFSQNENMWIFNQELKKHVEFKQFNLQNSFAPLGIFDLILCRYVIIYFADSFKTELFRKIARALKPGGVLLLGSGEYLNKYSNDFNISHFGRTVINTKK